MERALDTETEMDRLWFASYPKDVPHTVDPDAYSSLTDMLLKTCEMEAKKKAFYCLGSSLTYGQVDEASLRVTAYLQQQCGVGVGDRVAIMLPNLLQYPVVMLAVLRIGAVVVNVNPRYTQREVEAILDDSGAVCMVLLKPFLGVLHGLGDHLALKHVLFSTQ